MLLDPVVVVHEAPVVDAKQVEQGRVQVDRVDLAQLGEDLPRARPHRVRQRPAGRMLAPEPVRVRGAVAHALRGADEPIEFFNNVVEYGSLAMTGVRVG